MKCYYCGGMLRHWEDTDDVWEEHKKWFPLCLFVVEHDPATHPELGRFLHRTISGIAVANGFTEENVQQFRDHLTGSGQSRLIQCNEEVVDLLHLDLLHTYII